MKADHWQRKNVFVTLATDRGAAMGSRKCCKVWGRSDTGLNLKFIYFLKWLDLFIRQLFWLLFPTLGAFCVGDVIWPRHRSCLHRIPGAFTNNSSWWVNEKCFFNQYLSRGRIFSRVWPLYERAVINLEPWRSMHRPVEVAHSSFIEGAHMTKSLASGPYVI